MSRNGNLIILCGHTWIFCFVPSNWRGAAGLICTFALSGLPRGGR